MNMGFREGASLAAILHKILREGASPGLLETYNRDLQKDWQVLLARSSGLKPRSGTNPWIAKRCDRILPCLPACGPDLEPLAAQLDLALG